MCSPQHEDWVLMHRLNNFRLFLSRLTCSPLSVWILCDNGAGSRKIVQYSRREEWKYGNFYTQTPGLWERTALPKSFRRTLLDTSAEIAKIAKNCLRNEAEGPFGHLWYQPPAAFDGYEELYTHRGYIPRPFQPWLNKVKPSSWCKSQPDLRGLFMAFLAFGFPSPPPSAFKSHP